MTVGMSKLILFDIDGTLVNTAGAGRRAISRSVETLYSISDAVDGVDFVGRSDLYILKRALMNAGVPARGLAEAVAAVKAEYLRVLPRTLEESRDGRALAGVVGVLEGLRNGVQVGLATGNFRESAFMKLKHYALAGHFATGGFGDDTEERSEIVGEAIRRCVELVGVKYDTSDVYVVGDSPLDILAGKAKGVRTVAVASGWTSYEELAAQEPTLLFYDLSDVPAFLEAVGCGKGT